MWDILKVILIVPNLGLPVSSIERDGVAAIPVQSLAHYQSGMEYTCIQEKKRKKKLSTIKLKMLMLVLV